MMAFGLCMGLKPLSACFSPAGNHLNVYWLSSAVFCTYGFGEPRINRFGRRVLNKPATRKQYAALPWRHSGGGREVLLISSRDTGRWVIPKGWPIKGLSPAETAAREAYEEAGLGGTVSKKSLGQFEYRKRLDNGNVQPCRVEVFAFEQMVQHPDWPEQGQRTLQWFSIPDAADAVDEPDLKDIIRKLR
jgi:8-oxo-dGTP pyrophosphatase MutT (NUDIX family)